MEEFVYRYERKDHWTKGSGNLRSNPNPPTGCCAGLGISLTRLESVLVSFNFQEEDSGWMGVWVRKMRLERENNTMYISWDSYKDLMKSSV